MPGQQSKQNRTCCKDIAAYKRQGKGSQQLNAAGAPPCTACQAIRCVVCRSRAAAHLRREHEAQCSANHTAHHKSRPEVAAAVSPARCGCGCSETYNLLGGLRTTAMTVNEVRWQ
jgi:hypothetical protein